MLLTNFMTLFLESAFWLLLGLVLAGMLKMFISMTWMHKQLGGHGFKSTVKAALLGAPLPLCSCGVIPAAIGLRRAGASKAATTSFLVSTPETGVDSITVSYVLLGPFMAVVRPIAAITSAIVAGLLVGRDDVHQESKNLKIKNGEAHPSCCSSEKEIQSSCCSSEKETQSACCSSEKETQSACCSSEKETQSSCCSSKKETESSSYSSTKDIAQDRQNSAVSNRIAKGLHYAATDLIQATTVWLLIGLFFAALVQTYIPTDFMVKWGDGLLAMLVMVIISIPMYICATASTPIAAGLLLSGVSPGAVLVFMLAGPATNIATLGVVANELGKRALWGYLVGVLGVALVSGVIVNYLVNAFEIVVMPQIGEHHALLPDSIVYFSGMILAILMARVLFKKISFKLRAKSCCS